MIRQKKPVKSKSKVQTSSTPLPPLMEVIKTEAESAPITQPASETTSSQTDDQTPESTVSPNEPVNDEAPAESETTPDARKSKFLFTLGIGFSLGIVIATGMIFWLWQTQPVRQEQQIEPVIESAPNPETKPALDKSLFIFEVLNGSGVPGAAAKATLSLTELGFTVVTTGNADRQSYTETKVYVSEELEDKAEILLTDLKLEYQNATFSGILKPDQDSSASARIIIGKTE